MHRLRSFATATAMSSTFLMTSLFASPEVALKSDHAVQADHPRPYQAIDFSNLLGLSGLSDTTLTNHFKLYQGYVTNTNLLLTTLQELADEGKQRTPQYQEIKRRLGWEFDGMRLHELYFDNLSKEQTNLNPQSSLGKQINQDYGSYEAWKKDFIETGMLRGIGWSILYFDPISNRLINTWIGEHDLGHLAGGKPILVMDVWEHAYLIDFGLDRKGYIDVFFNHINWDVVGKRYP